MWQVWGEGQERMAGRDVKEANTAWVLAPVVLHWSVPPEPPFLQSWLMAQVSSKGPLSA